MRWDSLTLDSALETPPDSSQPALPLPIRDAVVRTFDTPGFRGITFYEVRSRSALNRVPDASRVPFRWTVNPYRGCSHACVYCLVGDTQILMADGTVRDLADLRIGDEIIGTQVVGRYRRYVRTTVLAHWRTEKAAYRVRLRDGTTLIASGDHRFLTDRGWKHVAPDAEGRRPHLTVEDALRGFGLAALKPQDTSVDGLRVAVGADLRVESVEPLGVILPMYDITTGTGDFVANGVVSHNCFARNTHTYLDLDAGLDFDSKIIVKVNVAERLRAELAARSWRGEHVAMGTNVDPYQRAEGRYQLMPGVIQALRDARNPFSILTKGSLILRDRELIAECAELFDVGVNVSVGSVDRELWRLVEPGTPSPQKRLEVARAFTDAGVGCGVLMAPVLPGLSDSDAALEQTVRAIAESGARSVTPIVLHLRTGAREWYLQWLGEHFPHLLPDYERLYGRGAYAPKAYQQWVAERVLALAELYGVGRTTPRAARRVRAAPAVVPPTQPEQLTLGL